MKKLLLFTGMILCSGAFAQQSLTLKSPISKKIKSNSIALTKPHQVVKKVAGGPNEAVSTNNLRALHSRTAAHRNGSLNNVASTPETIIGSTVYDAQTNGTISNRVVNVNGKISATWTMSLTGNTTSVWPDRGTGYNYSADDGATWLPQPTARIESIRTGYQNVAVGSCNEVILAHSAVAATGLPLTGRATQGTGPWTTSQLPGTLDTDLWPKFTAGGADGQSFHAIWQGTGTASGPMFYSRSTDCGATWSAKAEIPGMIWGTDIFAVSAEDYAIDARGDVIAIVIGDFGTDVTLLKSVDNGVTWTKRIIDRYPIPLYDPATMNTDTNGDGIADTLWSGVGDATVVIDKNNIAHVFYGRTRSLEDVGATGLSYFQTFDLCYWNELYADNQPSWLATPPDLNGDGVINVPTGCNFDPAENAVGYYSTGLVAFISMPKAGVDANNNIYLSYQAADELSDTSIYGQMFVHQYLMKSCDGGVHWTNPDSVYDVVLASQPVDAESYDGSFGNMATNVDSKVHMTYQRDFAPGTTLGGTNFPCEFGNNNEASNEYVYIGISIDSIPCQSWVPQPVNNNVGISTISNNTFSIGSNYPNPFRGKTSVNITLKKSADVTVEVSDLVGRVLSVQKYSNFGTGTHTLTIDATKYATGVYTYKVQAGNDSVTKKMIVQ
jgi:hypothetical protein